ncbi:MFS transporter [Nonomuraea longicatena]|uniref:MFS transporter n=1 Tax=Nonomuraea longicatena TaxID=83682 RepID=A0ABN1PLD5_9ACTN
MPADPTLRAARSAVFAVVCAGLAAAAHLMGGGTVPLQAFVLAVGGGLAIGLAATGRERPLPAIMVVLASGQLGSHLLFSSLDPAPAVHVSEPHSGLSPGLGMLLLHTLATVLTAWWLERGEVALWALLRRLAAHVVWYLCRHDVSPTRAEPRPVEPERVAADAVPLWLSHALVRRGPPAA